MRDVSSTTKVFLRRFHSHQALPSIMGLLLLCSLCQCGAQRELSGIWQQAPLIEGETFDRSTHTLYELHIGQYGERMTGLSVRYQRPDSTFLSTFDRGDRCDCTYLIQGNIQESIAFTLLDPQTPRSVSSDPICVLPHQECARIFYLEVSDNGEELVGETWCEPDPNLDVLMSERTPIRFVRVTGIPINECQPIDQEASSQTSRKTSQTSQSGASLTGYKE